MLVAAIEGQLRPWQEQVPLHAPTQNDPNIPPIEWQGNIWII